MRLVVPGHGKGPWGWIAGAFKRVVRSFEVYGEGENFGGAPAEEEGMGVLAGLSVVQETQAAYWPRTDVPVVRPNSAGGGGWSHF